VKKIYIRCDAGNVKDFGTGHVSRMIILAESLRKKIKWIEVIFLTRNDNNFQQRSEEINKILTPLNKSLFIESNPSPVKYAASLLGLCPDDVRLPLVNVTENTKQIIKEALHQAKLI
jgi:hypothetical protein